MTHPVREVERAIQLGWDTSVPGPDSLGYTFYKAYQC